MDNNNCITSSAAPLHFLRFVATGLVGGIGGIALYPTVGKELYPYIRKTFTQLPSWTFKELGNTYALTSFAFAAAPIAITSAVHDFASKHLSHRYPTTAFNGTFLLKNAILLIVDVAAFSATVAALAAGTATQIETGAALAVGGALAYLISQVAIFLFNSINPYTIAEATRQPPVTKEEMTTHLGIITAQVKAIIEALKIENYSTTEQIKAEYLSKAEIEAAYAGLAQFEAAEKSLQELKVEVTTLTTQMGELEKRIKRTEATANGVAENQVTKEELDKIIPNKEQVESLRSAAEQIAAFEGKLQKFENQLPQFATTDSLQKLQTTGLGAVGEVQKNLEALKEKLEKFENQEEAIKTLKDSFEKIQLAIQEFSNQFKSQADSIEGLKKKLEEALQNSNRAEENLVEEGTEQN